MCSRFASRSQQDPSTHTPSLTLDVRPLPGRSMFDLPHDLHCSALGIQPLGLLTNNDIHVPRSAVYNRSSSNRNSDGKLVTRDMVLDRANPFSLFQFIIMQNAITSATQLNIGASIGVEMFAFMWVAAATAVLAWLIQFGMCCCCASRRDVKTGRKRGSMKAWESDGPSTREKQPGRFSSSS